MSENKESTEDEVFVGEGEIVLVKKNGKILLVQGDVAVDVTEYATSMDYGFGRLTLTIRESGHKEANPSHEVQDELRKKIGHVQGPEVDAVQEEGFTKVSGADTVVD